MCEKSSVYMALQYPLSLTKTQNLHPSFGKKLTDYWGQNSSCLHRDCQGYGKPGRWWVGYSQVRIGVEFFYPPKTHTLVVGMVGIC